MTPLAERLARPEVLALPPFDLGERWTDGLADAVLLDANESPFAPFVEGPLAGGLNRYPEPQPTALRRAMAALWGVDPEALLVVRGGDDAIDLLTRTFCRPGIDAVSACPPTFAAYAWFARLQGARVLETPLSDGFAFATDAVIDACRAAGAVKLVFVCSPNNPTGTPVEPAEVLRLADALPEALVVLDEAYLEFSDLPSLAGEAARRPNLVVLKTLSKAWGLAGARVGAVIAAPETVAMVARALPPYPLPGPSVQAALAALAPSRRLVQQERIALIRAERERLAGLLARAPGVRRVVPSGGNFLFLEHEAPEVLAVALKAAGVRARFRPKAAPGGVRLTIGTPEENRLALAAFGVTAEAAPARRAESSRDTRETSIAVAVDLDRATPRRIETGVPFYDHMLDQVAAHGGFSLVLSCEGDLEIDAHHTVEDCAIALGRALSQALGDRRGIGRFGFALPMDESEAQVLIDLSGRPYSVFEGDFSTPQIGAYPTEMTRHVFRSLADAMGAAIHVRVSGENDHHKTEACFKAFGRALRQAIARQGEALPSTKGVL